MLHAAVPAALGGWVQDAGYIVGFGAGTGIVIGAVVGALGKADHSGLAVAGGSAMISLSPHSMVIGWRRPLRR